MPGTKFDLKGDELRGEYLELILKNPVLAKIEAEALTLRWTEEQIRTAQLIAAVRSNASLQQRLQEIEAGLAVAGR